MAVFVANYNHGHYIGDALDAILRQSVQPVSIDIFDDGSTDDSVEIIRRYVAKHSHVHLTSKSENQGVLANMIEWLAAVDTKYVYFAASDDVVIQGLFEQSLTLLRKNPEVGLCSSLCRLMGVNGQDSGMFKSRKLLSEPGCLDPYQARQALLEDDSWFNGSGTLYRREALIAAGGFRPELASFTDGFVSRVIAAQYGACFIPQALSNWRRDDIGFAGQTNSDISKAERIADCVLNLMQTVYAGIFPKGYAKVWHGRWLFGLYMTNMTSPNAQRWETASRIVAKNRVVRSILFPPILLQIPIWRKALLVFGLVSLRPNDTLRVIRRKLLRSWD